MKKIKVLQVTAVDVTVKYLLMPLIDRLLKEGYNVQIACSPGSYSAQLKAHGYIMNEIRIERRIKFFSNLKSFFELYKLIKREKFDIVHVHSPIASVLGRIAAKIAGVPVIIYTAHGFYFHENMAPWKRRIIIWIEKILGNLCTDVLFLQSLEDKETALKEKITPRDRIEWIGNGVNIDKFKGNLTSGDDLRKVLGIKKEDKVIGFVGRIVGEKGIEELINALNIIKEDVPAVKLVIAGDTFFSDRDRKTKERIKKLVVSNNLEERVIFTGIQQDIAKFYGVMDVFTLPSYREGMPRSIIEAMASGKAVVATNIRGSREEVIEGVTGYLVPVRDADSLAGALEKVLLDKDLASQMGKAGHKRAREMFDEDMVLDRQLAVYNRLNF